MVPLSAPTASQSPLLPLLTPTTLSPTLTHLHLFPAPLVTHIQESYNLLPPTPKWFNILLSVAARGEGDSTDCAGGWNGGVVVAIEKRGRKGKEGIVRSVEGLRAVKDGKAGQLEGVQWEQVGGLSNLKPILVAHTAEVCPHACFSFLMRNVDMFFPYSSLSRSRKTPHPSRRSTSTSPPPSGRPAPPSPSRTRTRARRPHLRPTAKALAAGQGEASFMSRTRETTWTRTILTRTLNSDATCWPCASDTTAGSRDSVVSRPFEMQASIQAIRTWWDESV